MNKEQIKVKLTALIEEEYYINEIDINEEAELTDLGLDSLDIAKLIMKVEKEFDIEIPDDDAEKLETFGSVLNYVDKKVNKV